MPIYKRLPPHIALLYRSSLLNDPIFPWPEVEGVDPADPEGLIPPGLITTGLTVQVPRWANHPTLPGRFDRLQVLWEFAGSREIPYDELIYPTPPPVIKVHIPPEYLGSDGIAYLSYAVWGQDISEDWSFKKKLTIDARTVPVDLKVVSFPDAESGKLNCQSRRKVWDGIRVEIPADPGCQIGDWFILHWNGYLAPNGSGSPIANTYKEVRRQILTDDDLRLGVEVLIEPYIPHIEPMLDNASGVAWYQLERNNRVIRRSRRQHVVIDRILPGLPPCGPV